ncbi:MAG: cell division protein FtsZ [Firmicutes bacterium]|nr:cell division protein FtsZ [Bacillota bacterium]
MQVNKNNTIRPAAIIKVVGVGGGGGNAINRMMASNVSSAEYIAVNTDLQDLAASTAHRRIQVGDKLTKGQGAGADPKIGQEAAIESKLVIAEALKGADLVFITAGMGGGTGTGAAPVVAQIAKELGILTVAVITKPFDFEGLERMNNAEIGIANLMKFVDTIIIIPNDKLVTVASKLTVSESFRYADEVLRQGVTGISDLIVTKSMINLDFADVRTIMKDKGIAHMGIGKGQGERRTFDAVKNAVRSPLLETSIEGATSVILNVIGSSDLTLEEVYKSANLVREVVDKKANIIFGADIRKSLSDEVLVTVIATGFPGQGRGKKEETEAEVAATTNVAQNRSMPNNNPLAVELPNRATNQTVQPLDIFSASINPQYAPQPQRQQSPNSFYHPHQVSIDLPRTHVAPDDTSEFPEFLRRLNDRNNK